MNPGNLPASATQSVGITGVCQPCSAPQAESVSHYPRLAHNHLCGQERCRTSGNSHPSTTMVCDRGWESIVSHSLCDDFLCLKHSWSLLGDFERNFFPPPENGKRLTGRERLWSCQWTGASVSYLPLIKGTRSVHSRRSLFYLHRPAVLFRENGPAPVEEEEFLA